jgi:RecA-family ATPase
MKTASDILREFGLPPPPPGAGRYYSPCPKCSDTRTPAHRNSKCLGITIDGDGVRLGCNHCGWTGGEYYNGKTNGRDDDPVIATYEYSDESGAVLFRKVKTASKKFWQQRPDGHGGWANGIGDVRRVLYCLPEVIEAIGNDQSIVIVEGEKDCDSLRKIGIAATCNCEGASEPGKKAKWRSEYSETLRGANVVVIPDHDEPGYAHVHAIAKMSSGVANSVRILNLAEHWPACPKGGDISDWLAAGHRREELDSLIAHAGQWTPPPQAEKLPPLAWVDMSKWDSEPPPKIKWSIPDRVPLKQAGLFSGEGGTGKSIIELTKDAAHAIAKDWFGSLPEPGPAFYIGAEDEEEIIHIRLHRIACHFGVTFKDLIDGGLHILCMMGQDTALCHAKNKSGIVEVTTLYKQVYEAAGDIKPKNISVDPLSHAFVGNEIDRAEVYGFVRHMRALALVSEGAVTVVGHPSLQGIASGSGYSGSTAWHNAFRFRQYLKGAEKDDEAEGDVRKLEFKKNQYGPMSESIALRYEKDKGLFLPVGGTTEFERAAAEQAVEQLFLSLLVNYVRQNRSVSDKKSAPNYAPSEFEADPEAKAAKISKTTFANAMSRLFKADRIHVEQYGRPSRPYSKLVPGPAPDRNGGSK